ncbi:hypothetical protein ES706_05749 [subsurface metagenome]
MGKFANASSVLISFAVVLSVLSALAIQSAGVGAVPGATSVGVSPSTQTVLVGENFTVGIAVNPAEPVYGIALELRFDPALVSATEVLAGDLGAVNETDFYLVVKNIFNQEGIVELAGLTVGKVNTISSPGTLATIKFISKSAGTSGLAIEDLGVRKFENEVPVLAPSEASSGGVLVVAPPEVLSVVPSEAAWDPGNEYTITATVGDNNGLSDLDNIIVKAYSGDMAPDASDSERDHYTFWFDPSDNSWHSSLGPEFIDAANCFAPEDLSENEGEYVFAVNLAKIAEPTKWNVCAQAVDSYEIQGSLENAEAVTVMVYTEFSLDRYALNFSGMPGETVNPELGPSIVTVTTNKDFDFRVRLPGDWTTDGLTMPMETTTATGDTTVALTDSYQTVWTGVGYGEDVARQIAWGLNIPDDQGPGTYRTSFYVNVAH